MAEIIQGVDGSYFSKSTYYFLTIPTNLEIALRWPRQFHIEHVVKLESGVLPRIDRSLDCSGRDHWTPHAQVSTNCIPPRQGEAHR